MDLGLGFGTVTVLVKLSFWYDDSIGWKARGSQKFLQLILWWIWVTATLRHVLMQSEPALGDVSLNTLGYITWGQLVFEQNFSQIQHSNCHWSDFNSPVQMILTATAQLLKTLYSLFNLICCSLLQSWTPTMLLVRSWVVVVSVLAGSRAAFKLLWTWPPDVITGTVAAVFSTLASKFSGGFRRLVTWPKYSIYWPKFDTQPCSLVKNLHSWR